MKGITSAYTRIDSGQGIRVERQPARTGSLEAGSAVEGRRSGAVNRTAAKTCWWPPVTRQVRPAEWPQPLHTESMVPAHCANCSAMIPGKCGRYAVGGLAPVVVTHSWWLKREIDKPAASLARRGIC